MYSPSPFQFKIEVRKICIFPFLCHKHHEDDEEDDENSEDLDHEPAIGRNRLEVFEDLAVSSLDIQMGVFNIGIDSEIPSQNIKLV